MTLSPRSLSIYRDRLDYLSFYVLRWCILNTGLISFNPQSRPFFIQRNLGNGMKPHRQKQSPKTVTIYVIDFLPFGFGIRDPKQSVFLAGCRRLREPVRELFATLSKKMNEICLPGIPPMIILALGIPRRLMENPCRAGRLQLHFLKHQCVHSAHPLFVVDYAGQPVLG